MRMLTQYTPNDGSHGFIRIVVQAAEEIYHARSLVLRLFVRDFKAQYQQSVLGYVWAAILPIVGVFSFVFLNYAGVLNPGKIEVSYPVYVFVGTSIWTLFIGAVGAVSVGLRSQADLILRTNIPKIALVAASFATVFYSLLVSLIISGLLLLLFRVTVHWTVVLYPFLILPIIICGIGLGLAISVVGVIARDAISAITQILNVLMYFTPVVYLSTTINQPLLRKIIFLNPLTYLIDVPRCVLFGQSSDYWWEYAGATALSFVVFIFGMKIFYLVQDLIAERL